jgi:hypothetical protein
MANRRLLPTVKPPEKEAQMTRYQTPTFSPTSAFARTLRGGEVARLARRRYQTPTFSPSSAFARTLRGGEIALLERRRVVGA